MAIREFRAIKTAFALSLALTASAAVTGAALADADSNSLTIDGVTIPTEAAAPAGSSLEKLYSGWRFRSPETQNLQTDDFENPAIIAVDKAIVQWSTVDGTEGKSCASCHEDVEQSMLGVRAGIPAMLISVTYGRPFIIRLL